jgi:hypothetical protein
MPTQLSADNTDTDGESVSLDDLTDPFSENEDSISQPPRSRLKSSPPGLQSKLKGHKLLHKVSSEPPLPLRPHPEGALGMEQPTLKRCDWVISDDDQLFEEEVVLHPWDPGYKRKTCVVKLDGCRYTIGNYITNQQFLVFLVLGLRLLLDLVS